MLTIEHYDNIIGGAEWLKGKFGEAPKLAIITGSSGPQQLLKCFTEIQEVELDDYFPLPTVEGHFQHAIYGKLGGKSAIWFPGRTHFNEHKDIHKTVMVVRALAWWGCTQIIMTNLVGSLNEKFPVGSIVVVKDHLSLFSVPSPLMGNADILAKIGGEGSNLHVDMGQPYSPRLIALLKQISPDLQEVVSSMRPGPEFETHADANTLRILGADIVGMSTLPDVIALSHMASAKHRQGDNKIEVCVLSQISNVAGVQGLSHQENLAIARQRGPEFAELIAKLVARL